MKVLLDHAPDLVVDSNLQAQESRSRPRYSNPCWTLGFSAKIILPTWEFWEVFKPHGLKAKHR